MSTIGSGMVQIHMDPPAVRVAREFEEMRDRAYNMSFVFARVRDQVLRPQFQENFESYGQGTWENLADWTIRDRARRGYGPHPILQRRGWGGGLIQSATSANIWKVTNQGIEYDGLKSNRYGEAHHTGFDTPIGRVPAREWIYITEENIEEIRETIAEYIATGD